MEEKNPSSKTPTVSFHLQFSSSLHRCFEADELLQSDLCLAVAETINSLLQELGLSGQVEITLSERDKAGEPYEQFFAFYQHGHQLRYPDDLLKRVYAYIGNQITLTGSSLQDVTDWLETQFQDTGSGQMQVKEFFRLACHEILVSQPTVLVGPEQVNAYLAELIALAALENTDLADKMPPYETMYSVMSTVVGMGISLTEREKVVQLLYASTAQDVKAATIAEALIAGLRPPEWEIHLPEAYLRELTLIGENALFPFMRDGLFVELGLISPDFKIVTDETIRPSCFAIRINHLLRLPAVGLQEGECLVNDTVDRLKLDEVNGYLVRNPATQQPNTVTSLDQKEFLEAKGLTTWDRDGYLILALAELIRKNIWRTVDTKTVRQVLDQMEMAFPEIVQKAVAQHSQETITLLLRGLIAEETSVRNMRRILERLLDQPFSHQDATRFLVVDDRPTALWQPSRAVAGEQEQLLEFVRAGLKDQISYKAARSTNTIVAYLLDMKLEDIIATWPDTGWEDQAVETEKDAVIQAIRAELRYLPPTAQTPVILTTPQSRHRAAKILRQELPRLRVLSYDELLPDFNIQPVARISFPA